MIRPSSKNRLAEKISASTSFPGLRKLSVNRINTDFRPRDILSEPLNTTQQIDLGDYEGSSIHNVRDLVKNEHDEDCPPVFCEMLEFGETEDNVWNESARWVKFEETVETDGRRWSKPHVTLLTLTALIQLRSCFRKGVHHYTSTSKDYSALCDEVINAWTGQFHLEPDEIYEVSNMLRSKKHHLVGSAFKESGGKVAGASAPIPEEDENEEEETQVVTQTSIMKKIRENSQGAAAFIARCPALSTSLAAFVRMKKETHFPGVLEIPIPVRFFFFLLTPMTHSEETVETIGRAFGVLMVDEIFAKVAYRANSHEPLIGGIDEFMGQMTTIPAGKCPLDYRMEPHDDVKIRRDVAKTSRRASAWPGAAFGADGVKPKTGLERTGRCFGGLVEDLKRKQPFYRGEFDDALNMGALPPIIASSLFIFIAEVTKLISFGIVTEDRMGGAMGISEHLLSGALFGCIFALFAGQPLSVPSPSGATFLFELILYDLCNSNGWSFLEFRVWIGIWVFVSMIIFTAIDASALVRYATKFTQEPFAVMNSVVFMMSSIKSVLKILNTKPIMFDPQAFVENPNKYCGCSAGNSSNITSLYSYGAIYHDQNSIFHECKQMGEEFKMTGELCTFFPDVFMFSLILFFCTIMVVFALSRFRNAIYFPSKVRELVSDFSVMITIIIMTAVAYVVGLKVPTLQVPDTLEPTTPRSWIINPFAVSPGWLPILAIFPGILFAILNIMGQCITAAIVNRKEHKLRKGFGYHLDMLVIAGITLLSAFLGIPFLVSAPVVSIMHLQSLKRFSENAAPGENPQFLGIREQRVTNFLSHLLIGLSILLTPVLTLIPGAVLFGIFFYMGLASLFTQAMFLRVLLFFIPVKYQPDYKYLRLVRLKRVHLYTIIEVLGFAALMIVNQISAIAIIFPLALILLMAMRKGLDKIFDEPELEALDMKLPSLKDIWRPDEDYEDDEEKPGCCRGIIHKIKNRGHHEDVEKHVESGGVTFSDDHPTNGINNGGVLAQENGYRNFAIEDDKLSTATEDVDDAPPTIKLSKKEEEALESRKSSVPDV